MIDAKVIVAYEMHWITALFVGGLLGATLIRLWLASRQLRAVQAQREHVPSVFAGEISPSNQRRAAEYVAARVRLGRFESLLEAFLKLLMTLGGGLTAVEVIAQRTHLREPWQGTVTVLSVLLLLGLAGLPFALWRTFHIEAKFGFNRTSPALYARDLLKQLLLGFLIGAPVIFATLALMEKSPAWWWIWVWLVWCAVMVALTWAAPRFIAPLFNRFSPLEDAALRQRVEALLERCEFAARGGVFVMDGSRRSAHGNAYFAGIGGSRRIVLFDTLMARLGADEIEAVLAHELGHFRLHHVRQRLVLSVLAAFTGMAVLGALAREPVFYSALGVAAAAPAMALLLFMLTAPVFSFFATPLGSWWSRRQELAADDFAVKNSSASSLANALVKLYRDNATALAPDALYSRFYYSHPPASLRIARLRSIQGLAADLSARRTV